MTSQQKDKYICQQLGMVWHEQIGDYPCSCGIKDVSRTLCSCGVEYRTWDKAEHLNPDFTSEAGRVLEIMKSRMEEEAFNAFVLHNYGISILTTLTFADEIIDKTGKLRDRVFRWMGGVE